MSKGKMKTTTYMECGWTVKLTWGENDVMFYWSGDAFVKYRNTSFTAVIGLSQTKALQMYAVVFLSIVLMFLTKPTGFQGLGRFHS